MNPPAKLTVLEILWKPLNNDICRESKRVRTFYSVVIPSAYEEVIHHFFAALHFSDDLHGSAHSILKERVWGGEQPLMKQEVHVLIPVRHSTRVRNLLREKEGEQQNIRLSEMILDGGN